MSKSSSIAGAFSRLAARRSTDVMVTSPLAKATFGEIDALSRAVAAHITESGVAPGSLIGLAAPNGPAFLAGFLALRRAGQTVVLLDPLAPDVDRQRVVAAIGATSVLSCADAWPTSAADFKMSPLVARAQGSWQSDIAAVKLTSGSTGAPRGVAMRDEHLLADEAALFVTMGFAETDRLLASIPFSHSYGFTTLALSTLVRGLTLVLPTEQGPFAPLEAARALDATIFPTVPAYCQALLKMSAPPRWPASLRLVITAGAVMPAGTAAHFRETYGQPVHVFYGSSECGGICYDREGGAAERGAVGTAVDGVRVSITPIDQDSAGEGIVTVESAAVGDTYVPDRDSRLRDGRFETSDVGELRAGEIVLRRRVDHVINLRGRKVDPSEVEKVLSALDGVDEAVVLGVRAPGGDEVLRAVVACAAGRLEYQHVAAWCRHRLADHKVPRSVIIVNQIPRTPRGKIDRAALIGLASPKDAEARG